jgi:hypothetical protein
MSAANVIPDDEFDEEKDRLKRKRLRSDDTELVDILDDESSHSSIEEHKSLVVTSTKNN